MYKEIMSLLIIKKSKKISIENMNEIEYEEVNHIINPYIMGCIIGDGLTTRTPDITSIDDEILIKIKQLLPENVTLSQRKCKITYGIVSTTKCKENSVTKRIRKALLNG